MGVILLFPPFERSSALQLSESALWYGSVFRPKGAAIFAGQERKK